MITKKQKRLVFPALFAIEVVVCLIFYCFGANGIQGLRTLQRVTEQSKQELALLETEVAGLESELYAFMHHSFYKEKIAREQLQMARKEEIIYYIA